MNPSFDIFQAEGNDVIWMASATSVGQAKAYIDGLELKSGVEFFVLNQRTGEKTAIKLDSIRSSAQSA